MEQQAYYEEADEAIVEAVKASREDPDATFWVTLQPSGWSVKRSRRCPDARSVPLWRVRGGQSVRLMEFPG